MISVKTNSKKNQVFQIGANINLIVFKGAKIQKMMQIHTEIRMCVSWQELNILCIFTHTLFYFASTN